MSDSGARQDSELIAHARAQIAHAYAPYSHFKTGATVVTETDELVGGAIVENVSLGLAMCAERVALFSTAARGLRPVAVALAAPDTDGTLTWPCGACLQVVLELGGPDCLVVVGDDDAGPTRRAVVADLLPNGPRVEH